MCYGGKEVGEDIIIFQALQGESSNTSFQAHADPDTEENNEPTEPGKAVTTDECARIEPEKAKNSEGSPPSPLLSERTNEPSIATEATNKHRFDDVIGKY